MKTIGGSIFAVILASLGLGCASVPSADPEAPVGTQSVQAAPRTSSAPAPSAQPAPNEAAADASTPAQSGEPDPRSDGLRKASRPPAELITNPTVLYVLNFNESAAGQTARQQCEESTDGSPNLIAACVQKARSKLPVESMRFVKKGKDEYWWITLNRYRGNLLKWHVIQFQVGEETGDHVVLKPMGKDKGIAPMTNIPRSLEIDLPNDYSIVVSDPELGKLVLEAKIGKIEEPQP